MSTDKVQTILCHTLFGSWIYGTNIPTSDRDYKMVFLPIAKDIILNTTKESFNQTTKVDLRAKNTEEDEETEFFSLKRYLKLLCEGQTVALDILFVPENFYLSEPSPIWVDLKKNKDKWLSKQTGAFFGYCLQQSSKYGIKGSRVAASRATVELFDQLIENHGHLAKLKDHWNVVEDFVAKGIEHISIVEESCRGSEQVIKMLEVCNRKVQASTTLKEAHKVFKRVFDEYGARALQAESNENIDYKALCHAVRVLTEAKELLTTGSITFPLINCDLLLKIRLGQMAYKEIAEII